MRCIFMKSHKKILFCLVLLVAVLSIWFIYMGQFDKKPITYTPKEVKINGVFLAESKTIQDFQLTDHKGRQFSKNNLMGHWTIMFFGFTHCGYVCPTTMTELNKMYHTLKLELPNNK